VGVGINVSVGVGACLVGVFVAGGGDVCVGVSFGGTVRVNVGLE